MDSSVFLLVACSAGVFQSMFLSVYFFSQKKMEAIERALLSTLFFLISLRLIKSLGWYFFGIEDDIVLNIGFSAHAFIGPVLLYYLLENQNKIVLRKIVVVLLFLPAIFFLVFTPFVNLNDFWYRGGYTFLLYSTVFYLACSGYLVWVIQKENNPQHKWFRNLFICIAIFSIFYFTNYILGWNSYILGTLVYSAVVYLMSYFVFTSKALLSNEISRKKYTNINLSEEQLKGYINSIKRLMEEENLYLNGDFSLTVLSKKSKIPKHLLSLIFNEVLEQSFTDFTNRHRIEHAKKLLLSEQYKNHKIAAIAFECGFNSLSTFNSSYKKILNCTPSEYKNKYS